ncbi:MAG: hypothetical protein KIS88_01395 [Anaerolineales bacterium]|nr:hypothetical protein [Anaerolineales bacterium]
MYRMAAILVLALLSSACGSQPTAAEVVPIELTEFAIHSPISVFKVGTPYRFIINNPGAVNHEFVLLAEGEEHHMQTAGQHGHDAEDGEHGHDDGHGDGHNTSGMLHVGESQLTPGASVTIEHTFTEPGDYEFGCYLPGHYAAGMYTKISVVP